MTLTLVGDVDQMMYRFSGARPELITEDVDQFVPGIETFFLSTNYRSTQEIISKCSALIAKNYSDQGGPYAQQFMKATQPRPDAPAGDPITFQMYADTRAEAQGVADIILEQVENGYQFGDFFVASRTRAQLGYIEGPLYRAGIKFVNITGGSFWDGFHVRNIIAFLELAHDTRNDEAFQRVYNIASASHTDRSGNYCHHHWMGREFLELTKGQYGLMHLAIAKNRRYYYGVTDLEQFVQEVQAEIAYADSPKTVINYIVENCYKQWMKAKGETDMEDGDSSISDDIATVLDVASQYSSVAEFLAYVADMRKAAEEAKNGNLDEYVVISTAHRLKGSERKIMVGIGWAEGIKQVGPIEMPVGLLPHTFSLTAPPQFGVLPTGGMNPIEDERCIAFVVISRAKDKVFLTAPGVYRDANMFPSRFISELGLLAETPAELPELSDKFVWRDEDITIADDGVGF